MPKPVLQSLILADHVYEDTVRGYEYSRRRAEAAIDASWDAVSIGTLR